MVASAAVVVRELAELIEQGHEIGEGTIAAVTSALDQHHSPAEILEDIVWRHRARKVAPKTVNQKRRVSSSGRTRLPSASARPARARRSWRWRWRRRSRREVNRIILTRPAVEAGERLGFLPGDMMAKVDAVPAAASTRCTT